MAHTPGPLVAANDNALESWCIYRAHLTDPTLPHLRGAIGEAQKREDAVLFAAASDLLAACKEWVAYMDQLDADSEPGDRLAQVRREYHGKRVAATRAAIARAALGEDTP